ncbi:MULTISPECIES: cobyric acid synthase [unclassified Luteococcus]|uniref:cobyric acid synthase n=1 Tax=unclassified Luteococcus TaxID=2639923 RepID=UPI00313ACB69
MTGILVTGTSSDAGKSLVVTGLCRVLRRRGLNVAPFKAQNMSNNSMVVADGEIGRAQFLQARAAGVEPTTAMNPVLIKPGTDRRAHVVLRGRPDGTLEAGQYATGRTHLAAAAFQAYRELAAAHDVVVCEGAGSPAEINLRSGDYVNMGLARQFNLPVVLVGDIDRGGVLASIYGTWALLEEPDRALLQGYLINKFRGDPDVLAPGLGRISELTGLRNFGVLNWLDGVWLDGEDALAIGAWRRAGSLPGQGSRPFEAAVVRFPRVSNATDVDALAAEPGVRVTVTADPQACAQADLLVLPGSRATTDDLAWLRAQGIDHAVTERHNQGRATLGICGGYQMLGRTIHDEVEGHTSTPVDGLGLLPVRIDFHPDKVLSRPTGSWRGHHTTGYEIHHGRPTTLAAPDEDFLEGMRVGATWGTHWHGALEHDGFRRAWLSRVAEQTGHPWRPDPNAPGYDERREAMINTLADALEAQVDVEALLALATHPQTQPGKEN